MTDVLSTRADEEDAQPSDRKVYGFRYTIDDEDGWLRNEIEAVRQARNELVHHFLSRWNPASADSTRDALVWLDQQHRQAQPLRETLKADWKARQTLAEWMASPEGERQMEQAFLACSPLIEAARRFARSRGEDDGWIDLSEVDQHLWADQAKEMKHLSKRYGHPTLKEAIVASGVFEVKDTPTAGGGHRTFIRVMAEAG
ncbi:hypothetical protein ACWA7J_15180 [Leptothrix sp. BB-4]